mgnify:CR=1 FL=1
MKTARVGQRVRLNDAPMISARFFDSSIGKIRGAGSLTFFRSVIDRPATVRSVAGKAKSSDRVLIEFDGPADDDGNLGAMWIETRHLDKFTGAMAC